MRCGPNLAKPAARDIAARRGFQGHRAAFERLWTSRFVSALYMSSTMQFHRIPGWGMTHPGHRSWENRGVPGRVRGGAGADAALQFRPNGSGHAGGHGHHRRGAERCSAPSTAPATRRARPPLSRGTREDGDGRSPGPASLRPGVLCQRRQVLEVCRVVTRGVPQQHLHQRLFAQPRPSVRGEQIVVG